MPAKTTAPKTQESAPAKKDYWWIIAGLILAVLTLSLSIWQVISGDSEGWERTWLSAVNGLSDSWRPFWLVVSFGPQILWLGLASVIVTYFLRLYYLSWRLAASILVVSMATLATQHWLGSPSPADLVPSLQARAINLYPGFPSFHAAIATVVLLTLFPYFLRGWRWAVLPLLGLLAVAGLYLGVNTPLDVIGGLALGAVVFFGTESMPPHWRSILKLD